MDKKSSVMLGFTQLLSVQSLSHPIVLQKAMSCMDSDMFNCIPIFYAHLGNGFILFFTKNEFACQTSEFIKDIIC